MKRRIILLVTIFVLSGYLLKAQIPKMPTNVPSPQAWNFTQYGKMPISHFTGLPNIGITLDELEAMGFSIPISLNYNVGSVRPDIHPGATGLGWNLSLGGVVNRKVRGLVDEFDYTQYNNYAGLGWDTIPYFNGYRNSSHAALADVNIQSILNTTRPLLCQGSIFTCGTPNVSPSSLRPISQVIPYLWDDVTYMAPNCSAGCTFYWPAYNSSASNERAEAWASEGFKDRQPDEFNFSVMGLSGKFYLPRGNETEVTNIVCNKKVKIYVSNLDENKPLPSALEVPTYNGPGGTADNWYFNMSPWQRNGGVYPKTIWYFKIIDEEGNAFFFGKSAEDIDYGNIEIPTPDRNAIEYGIGVYDINLDHWTADSWHLTRIELASGKKISYEYDRGDFQTNMFLSAFDSNVEDSTASASFSRFDRNGRFIYPSRLSRIYGEGFEARLGYSNSTQLRYERNIANLYNSKPNVPGSFYTSLFDYVNIDELKWPQLDQIQVKRYDKDTVFYNFTYTSDSTKRLYLNQVASSNGSTNNAVYKFSYNPDSLPNYLSGQTDHWGYWNGKTPTSNNPYVYYNDKQPDTTYLYSGTLKQIQYPTGGVTQLTYEPNEYAKIVKPVRTDTPDSAGNAFGGGLRIKRITDYDSIHSTPYNVKEYIYKRGYTNTLNTGQVQALASSGVLNMKPQYRWKGKSTYYNPSAPVTDSALFNVQSTQPLYYMTDEYQIGYSEVVEKSNDNSYTIYKFTNHDNGYKDETYVDVVNNVFNSPFTKYTDKSFERGQLLEKSNYDNSNTIVAKKTISYTVSDTSKPYINDCEASYFNNGAYHGGNSFTSYNRWILFGTQFKVYKYWFVPATEEESIYQNGQNPVVTKKEFFYENPLHGRVSRERTIDSKGDTLTTLYKYAKDYTGEFMLNTIASVRPATILEKLYMKKAPGGNQKITGGQINEFALKTGYSAQMPWLNSVYELQITEPFDSTGYTHTTPITRDFNGTVYSKDSRYKEVMKFNKYDILDNPLDVKNEKGERTVIVRGNQNSDVIATINPPTDEVAYNLWGYTSFEKYRFRELDGSMDFEYDSDKDFIYSGAYIDSLSFSGKASFIGTVTSKDYVHSCDIYVLAKHGGNAPIYQYLQGATTYTGTAFTKTGEKGNWDIYKVSHSNGGTKIIVNSDGNHIDEIRIHANNSKAIMETYCYENGLVHTITDKNFDRIFYEYDEYDRLKTIKDEKGKILKRIEYKYQTNLQQ